MRDTTESVKNEIQDWLAQNSEYLVTHCRVNQKQLIKFIYAAKSFTELRVQRTWLKTILNKAVRYYLTIYQTYTPDKWHELKKLDEKMPEFQILRERAKNVREVWRGRPTF